MTDVWAGRGADRDDIYWMEKLAPFGHGARLLPCVVSSRGDGRERVVASARVDAADVSPDVLCLAAFALVLSRHNGGEPLLIASPARVDAVAPGLMWLRCAPDEEHDAATLVAQVRAEMEEAACRQPCALERVGPGLGLDGTAQRAAFLQIGYAYGLEGRTRVRPGSDPPPTPVPAGFCLQVESSGHDVRLQFDFDASLYSRAFVGRLAAHTVRAIDRLAAAGGTALHDLCLLSADERRQVVCDFNETRVDVPSGLTVHGLVALQAARTPDSRAVVYKDVELTYRELDEQANRIADSLRVHYHVETGDVVGVMIDRSEKTAVALLGVMKAGAAYVPINPRHPWDTVSYMIENAGISVLIVDADSIAAAALFSGHLLVLDVELRGRGPVGDPVVAVSDTDLAYVIYTSGSTGKPKGVAIEHRAIVNTILWRNEFYGIGPADVNLQMPSFAFDSSVVDIFCILSVGGTLIVPEEDMRLDARHLKALCAARGVTSCIVTPSYYKLLVAELEDGVPSLRSVTLAGETATSDLVAAHLEHLPGVALFNEYGPTENAVCSTACRLDAVEPTVSIGRPIANVQVFILDARQRLCPIGVPGEMYLGGAGLARGYLNQEALTRERFIPSPIAADSSGVLYRTGDRACWREDGMIEFLGRLDSQVKVRGFRIELDEVELALLQHESVRNAAVVCKEDPSGMKYLAAYADTHDGRRSELRDHMRTRLPHYMVPDVLTVLPTLPLNLNGKVDRSYLRALDDFTTDDSAQRAAMTPLEASLLGLSAHVLKRVNMTLDDNFFELGGNSLRVMELTSRIRGELSLDVDLLDIYTFPTMRELAERLSKPGKVTADRA